MKLNERLSAEELDEIEARVATIHDEPGVIVVQEGCVGPMAREIRASWAESEALKEALRDFFVTIDHDPVPMPEWLNSSIERLRARGSVPPQPENAAAVPPQKEG